MPIAVEPYAQQPDRGQHQDFDADQTGDHDETTDPRPTPQVERDGERAVVGKLVGDRPHHAVGAGGIDQVGPVIDEQRGRGKVGDRQMIDRAERHVEPGVDRHAEMIGGERERQRRQQHGPQSGKPARDIIAECMFLGVGDERDHEARQHEERHDAVDAGIATLEIAAAETAVGPVVEQHRNGEKRAERVHIQRRVRRHRARADRRGGHGLSERGNGHRRASAGGAGDKARSRQCNARRTTDRYRPRTISRRVSSAARTTRSCTETIISCRDTHGYARRSPSRPPRETPTELISVYRDRY